MPGITIKVIAGDTPEKSSVVATGNLLHIIEDSERATFKVEDADLKREVGKYFGREPNDAYLKSPTPWGDLYKSYNWPEVQTVIVPKEAVILGIDSKPTIIATENLKNESGKPANFNANISRQMTNSVSNSWSKSSSVSFSQSISYEFGFLGTGAGGETSFGFEQQWGRDKTDTQAATVGVETGISVELQPGEEVIAELSASSGKMKVRITYEAYLTGSTAVNYNPTYKDHHFWGLPISAVLGSANSVTITEDMEIGFYSDAHAIIKNAAGEAKAFHKAVPGLSVASLK